MLLLGSVLYHTDSVDLRGVYLCSPGDSAMQQWGRKTTGLTEAVFLASGLAQIFCKPLWFKNNVLPKMSNFGFQKPVNVVSSVAKGTLQTWLSKEHRDGEIFLDCMWGPKFISCGRICPLIITRNGSIPMIFLCFFLVYFEEILQVWFYQCVGRIIVSKCSNPWNLWICYLTWPKGLFADLSKLRTLR